MSNHTHAAARQVIAKELLDSLRNAGDYYERTLIAMREIKLRLEMGETMYRDRDTNWMERPLTLKYAKLAQTLIYARGVVRGQRRKLWQFNALQRSKRPRVDHG